MNALIQSLIKKSLKQESADEPFHNHNYDENGQAKTNTSKFAFTGPIK